jgi:hypothetical protein
MNSDEGTNQIGDQHSDTEASLGGRKRRPLNLEPNCVLASLLKKLIHSRRCVHKRRAKTSANLYV